METQRQLTEEEELGRIQLLIRLARVMADDIKATVLEMNHPKPEKLNYPEP